MKPDSGKRRKIEKEEDDDSQPVNGAIKGGGYGCMTGSG